MLTQARLDKVAKNLTLRGVINLPYWLEKQVKLGRIHKDWIPLLTQIKTILQQVYPNNWDIYVNLDLIENYSIKESKAYVEWVEYGMNLRTSEEDITDEEWNNYYDIQPPQYDRADQSISIGFSPVVRFSDIIVSNSKGEMQEVKDLFFKFDISRSVGGRRDNKFTFNILEGVRTTVSETHYKANWYHSHLSRPNSGNIMSYRGFCTGAAEINQLAAKLNAEFDENIFKMFLMQLDTVAKWESLEGKPYYAMSDISSNLHNSTLDPIYSGDVKNIGQKIIAYIKEQNINLNWTIVDKQPTIIEDGIFHQAIKYLGDNPSKYPSSLICIKDSRGEFIRYIPLSKLREFEENKTIKETIPFRGKHIPLVILHEDNIKDELELKQDFYIRPEIKNYVKQQLEGNAAAYIYRQSLLKKLNSKTDNITANNGQNKVPV